MNASTNDMVLAAVMEALALMQDQLGAIQTRLDTIDCAQAGVTDLQPMLEVLLARVTDNHASTRGSMETIARIAGLAHAAASGSPAPLPSDVISDPLMERFRREMPADRQSPDRSLATWREAAARAATPDLAIILARQYQASPTETVDSVALRYRMAAVTREELQRRFVALPEHPVGAGEMDRSSVAQLKRAQDLAALWLAGPSPYLYGEAELAGAVAVLQHVEATGGIDRETIEGVRRQMGEHIVAGQRLSLRLATPFGEDGHDMDQPGLDR